MKHLAIFAFLHVSLANIVYLNGLLENERCSYSAKNSNLRGWCKKISDCREEYLAYKTNKTSLRVCNYSTAISETLICCSKFNETVNINTTLSFRYQSCRDKYLKLRKSERNIDDLIEAIKNKSKAITDEDCKNINEFGKYHKCELNELQSVNVSAVPTKSMEKGIERINMAAIGIVQGDGSLNFYCGGSILSERYVITAAHCRTSNGKRANIVRVGDRFLDSNENDEHAQDVRIEAFIRHPDFANPTRYNDIAIVRTLEPIVFNEFIVPACLGSINDDKAEPRWTVAGFSQKSLMGPDSTVVLEIPVTKVAASECNETYSDDDSLPQGILESQLCVFSSEITIRLLDTCYGDSGSPLQYIQKYTVLDDDYEKTFLKTTYEIPTVIATLSFGIGCGLDAPSVYSRLPFFINWIDSVLATRR